jgi:hypothetical protein
VSIPDTQYVLSPKERGCVMSAPKNTSTGPVPGSRLDRLWYAVGDHLRTTALLEPAVVSVEPAANGVQLQISGGGPAALAELLLHTYALQAVTATWHRTRVGYLHVSVQGRNRAGVRFTIYTGGVPYPPASDYVYLAVNERQSCSIDELRGLLDELRALADQQRHAEHEGQGEGQAVLLDPRWLRGGESS